MGRLVVLSFFGFQRNHCIGSGTQKISQLIRPVVVVKVRHIAGGFLSIGAQLRHIFIQLDRFCRTHGTLDAVQVYLGAEFQPTHIPNMGKIVFYTGSRTGNTCISHGNTANDQSFKDGMDGCFIPCQQSGRIVHTFFKRIPNQLCHRFAVVFAGDDMGNPPFGNADILGQHIAKTGLQQMFRRILQNISISDDHIGTTAVQRCLQAVHGH